MSGPRERFVRANGLVHHVLEWGDEHAPETVLFCHGFLDLAWGFQPLARELAAEGRRVVAFDFRGHGESEWIGAGGYYHFIDYLRDVHELLPQLASQPVHLVGHSMGGTVSVLTAATHPECVRTLSLLEGMGPPLFEAKSGPERALRWLREVDEVRAASEVQLRDVSHARDRLMRRTPDLPAEFATLLAEKSTRPHASGEGLTWRFDPLHRTHSPLGFDRARFLEFVAAIAAPTLLIAGSRGMRTGDEEARRAALAHLRAEHVIEGAGHMMHWTHAEECARWLNRHFAA